jgi:glutaredoxin
MTSMTKDAGPGTGVAADTVRRAELYRMATPEHLCPFGLRALDLLRREGYAVEDHLLTSRGQTDAFMAAHNVKTTPQAWIDGVRIGGYDDLRRHFGEPVADPEATTYAPVIAVFGLSALMALAASWSATAELFTVHALRWFAGFATTLLALQKLRGLESFVNGFLAYDLLAQRRVRYAHVYPFAEALVGLLMIADALPWIMVPTALVIGGVGAVSVVKAVYIDRRELKCACVGGDSNVPLGFISLTENVMMVAMALWMLAR